jgi:hypothetical protein
MKKKLEEGNKTILYGNRGSIDDSSLVESSSRIKIQPRRHLDDTCKPRENTFPSFGEKEKLSSFVEREKARKSSKMEQQI